MTSEKINPITVTYGRASGVYDPTTDLLKIEVEGDPVLLSIDAVMDNPELIAGFPSHVAYMVGWINSHLSHRRQMQAWVARGVVQINDSLLSTH